MGQATSPIRNRRLTVRNTSVQADDKAEKRAGRLRNSSCGGRKAAGKHCVETSDLIRYLKLRHIVGRTRMGSFTIGDIGNRSPLSITLLNACSLKFLFVSYCPAKILRLWGALFLASIHFQTVRGSLLSLFEGLNVLCSSI